MNEQIIKDNLIAEEIEAAFRYAPKKKKYYVVMLFETELNFGVKNPQPFKWINIANRFFVDGAEALDYYANTPNPASQIIDATSKENLAEKMAEMLRNYDDEHWLETELYPYL